MTKNKYSVKADIFDGAWKPTIEEAIDAFHQKLIKNNKQSARLYNVFIAEKSDEKTASMKDARGCYYNSLENSKEVVLKLFKQYEMIVASTPLIGG